MASLFRELLLKGGVVDLFHSRNLPRYPYPLGGLGESPDIRAVWPEHGGGSSVPTPNPVAGHYVEIGENAS